MNTERLSPQEERAFVLKSFLNHNYVRGLGYTSRLSEGERIKFLGDVFGKSGFGLNHPEELGKFISRVLNSNWVLPKENTTEEFIQENVSEHLKLLGLKDSKIRITNSWERAVFKRRNNLFEEDWRTNMDSYYQRLVSIARNTLPRDDSEIFNEFSMETKDIVTNTAFFAVAHNTHRFDLSDPKTDDYMFTVVGRARYLGQPDRSVQDPLEPLFNLHEKAVWPLGLSRGIFGKKFYVFKELKVH